MDEQRNWDAWRANEGKFSGLKSSQDFRRKKGILARIGDWLGRLLGK